MFGPEYRKQACFSSQNDFLYLEKLRPRTLEPLEPYWSGLSSKDMAKAGLDFLVSHGYLFSRKSDQRLGRETLIYHWNKKMMEMQ